MSPAASARFAAQWRGVAFGKPWRILTVAPPGVRCWFLDGHVERVHADYVATGAEVAHAAVTGQEVHT